MARRQIECSGLESSIAHSCSYGSLAWIHATLDNQCVLGAAPVRNSCAWCAAVLTKVCRYLFRSSGRHSRLGRFTEPAALNLPGPATRCGNSNRQDRARGSFLVCNSVPRRSHRSACARSSLAAARRSKRTRAAKKWVAAASRCLKWVMGGKTRSEHMFSALLQIADIGRSTDSQYRLRLHFSVLGHRYGT